MQIISYEDVERVFPCLWGYSGPSMQDAYVQGLRTSSICTEAQFVGILRPHCEMTCPRGGKFQHVGPFV